MMILHDALLNDGTYQQNLLDRTALYLQKIPLCILNTISKENFEQPSNSRKMVFYYSKRFPDLCMSSSFYEDIMSITEMHVSYYYQSRWFDFGQQNSEPSFNNSTVPWINRPVLQPIHTLNTFHSVQYNGNSNQRDFVNGQSFQEQVPNKLVAIDVLTPNSAESFSESSSPLDFEEPVTPIKIISNSNTNCKNSPEENNNKINVVIDDNDGHDVNDVNDDIIINGSISSDSLRSDTTDERIISYAEIIKHSKPSKPKQSVKVDCNVTEKFKKIEPTKSNRIPPSKKSSFKLPDAPYLPNNQFCAFCKNNGEEESVYRTHFVKDESGNVKCPFLSTYRCPQCKATGIRAHTISRCPLSNKNKINKFNK